MPRTAIALSGGGHRASVFGLGVLLYLADAGRNRQVVSVASVSGGSITNAFLAQEVDFATASQEKFESRVAAPLARRIAQRGVLLASPWTWVYLAALVAAAVALLVVPWFLPIPLWLQATAIFLGLPFIGWLAWQRGNASFAAYRRHLLSRAGRPTRLVDIRRGVHHAICATELRTGNHVYFSPQFIYGHLLGRSDPGEITLAKAVQASAAFPGGFPPVTLSTRSLRFTDIETGERPEVEPRRLVLADGGVYDNMADQWAHGFAWRAKRWPDLLKICVEPEELIVVNSSVRQPWIPFGRHLPIWAEVAALTREVDILYENTTAVRRRELVTRFDRAVRSGAGLRGALIMIRQDPWFVPRFFARPSERQKWPERGERAEAVLEVLAREDEDWWRDQVEASGKVSTNLRALGVETTAGLLHHAYVLAMCTLHVILGYPLLEMPARERFRALARG